MTADARLTGLVLAGGDSTRYGDANKLLQPVDGRPLVAHVVESVRAVSDTPPVVAVRTAPQREAIRDAVAGEVRFRSDHPDYEGPLAGLAGGLPAVDAPWLVVSAADMPHLSARALSDLAARREPATDAVVPVREGTREPLHAVYRRAAVADALPTLAPDAGPRTLCEALDATDVPVDAVGDHLERSLCNVNTPDEFARAVGTEPTRPSGGDG